MPWRRRGEEQAASDLPAVEPAAPQHLRPAGEPPRFTVDADEVARALARAVARALAEDLGTGGDVTSAATVAPGQRGSAEVVARAGGVVAGVAAVSETYAQLDGRVRVEPQVADGDELAAGDVIARVEGPLRSILTGERTALNLLGVLSGIATATRAYVDAVAGTGCEIRDTRKTAPGMRVLAKAAVAAGGGTNHRAGLSDGLLVKDNHVAAAGGTRQATAAALARAGGLPVQVEVTSLGELDAAIEAGATDILLDNFPPGELREAVERAGGRAWLEASGRITLEGVRWYGEVGVHRVAVGAPTHSAPALDVALDVTAVGPAAEPPAERVAAEPLAVDEPAPAPDPLAQEPVRSDDVRLDDDLLFGER